MTVVELLDILRHLPNDLEVKGFNHEFEAYIDPTVKVDHIIPDEEAWGGWRKIKNVCDCRGKGNWDPIAGWEYIGPPDPNCSECHGEVYDEKTIKKVLTFS